jgi:starvation-inducible DNA-binding protein
MKPNDLRSLRAAPLHTPTDLSLNATRDVAAALNLLLADTFALYVKTKNFHWHMSGPHFRDYHLLLDEHGDQIFAMTDALAAAKLLTRRAERPHTRRSRLKRSRPPPRE